MGFETHQSTQINDRRSKMNPLRTIAILAILLIGTVPAFAGQDAELKLWKRSHFLYGPCGKCAEFERFNYGKDRWDFSEFNLYYQDGYYTVDLTGPAQTAVTLFGAKSFKEERGYLVIVKKDDRPIEIMELGSFANEQWTDVSATEDYGAFKVYFKAYPLFANDIRSVAWKNIVE